MFRKSMILLLFVFTLISGFSGSVIAAESSSNESHVHFDESTNIESHVHLGEVTPSAIPCDYYPDGRHKPLYAYTKVTFVDGGTHQAIVINPDGSQSVVNCKITNVYEQDVSICACQNFTAYGPLTFAYTKHSYYHY